MSIEEFHPLSGLSGGDSLLVSTGGTVHTVTDDASYEVWMYASSTSSSTVRTNWGPESTLISIVPENSTVPILAGQVFREYSSFNPNADGNVISIALQSDDKIIICGNFTNVGGTVRNYIARLNADSTLDVGFNPDVIGTYPNNYVLSIALQPDGKALIGGGFSFVNNTERNRIARLNADGTLDTAFNPDVGSFPWGGVFSIVLQSDGKILIGGDFTSVGGITRNRIARLNADGTFDTGFNPNANSPVQPIAVQPDGKILIGGQFTSVGGTARNRIARLNADGTLDTGFDPNANSTANSIAVQPDGKIIVGGQFTTVGGTARNYIARLNTNGTLDTGFNPNANGSVVSLALQSDGKIIIGGQFTSVGGTTRNRIARLNADGTLDTGFDPNASSGVSSISIQSDGKILIGGQFTSVGGTTRRYIALLNTDGTLGNKTVSDLKVQATNPVLITGYVRRHT
jgi:uncharacterized delta-60 repeat protein